MTICLNCGKQCDDMICGECAKTVDIEKLCKRILDYDPKSLSDFTLDKLASELINEYNLRFSVFGLSEFLSPVKKQYYRMLAVKGKNATLPKAAGQWFIPAAEEMIGSGELTPEQEQLTDALRLTSCVYDYNYEEAERSAERLSGYGSLTIDSVLKLSDYYIKTRRYDKADKILNDMLASCTDENYIPRISKNLNDSKSRRLGKGNGGYAEYLPADGENRLRYKSFLESIGIQITLPEPTEKKKTTRASKYPTPIAKADYPELADERKAGFRSFVAYDVETTGLNPTYDSIIEIGAVRVCDGVITDRFQKFAKPYKSKITPEITELTGITEDMVKDAAQMWEAFNEFADFAGDDILVGYNNRIFDNKFLVRAGRYANRIIKNSSFDVMFLASEMSRRLGIHKRHISLGDLSEKLNITNPEAHRALADAETTARVYLALLDLGGYENKKDLAAILDDDWK